MWVQTKRLLYNGEFSIIKQSPQQWSSYGLHDDRYRQSGIASGVIKINSPLSGLIDEIVWVSGIRQRRGVDYTKMESDSLLDGNYDFNSGFNTVTIYSGEDLFTGKGFFNFWSGGVINNAEY